MVYKRTKAYGFLFLFIGISFVPVFKWEFISLLSSKNKPELLLVVAAVLTFGISLVCFIYSILDFIKKKDAITIKDKEVVLKTYKEYVISIDQIKDIKYHKNHVNNDGLLFAAIIGTADTGYIVFTLNDGKKLYVKEVMNVSEVCTALRELILSSK